MLYTCRNCGASSVEANSVCNAADGSPEAPFCGIPREWVCDGNLTIMNYSCSTCNSISAEPEYLCRPTMLKNRLYSCTEQD